MVIRPETANTQLPAEAPMVVRIPASGCEIVAVFCLKSSNCVQKTRARTERLVGCAINLASASNKPRPLFILLNKTRNIAE
jgi:hypothetical protein